MLARKVRNTIPKHGVRGTKCVLDNIRPRDQSSKTLCAVGDAKNVRKQEQTKNLWNLLRVERCKNGREEHCEMMGALNCRNNKEESYVYISIDRKS